MAVPEQSIDRGRASRRRLSVAPSSVSNWAPAVWREPVVLGEPDGRDHRHLFELSSHNVQKESKKGVHMAL